MVFANHLQKSQIFFIILFHKSIAQLIFGITFGISNQNNMKNYSNLNANEISVLKAVALSSDGNGGDFTYFSDVVKKMEIKLRDTQIKGYLSQLETKRYIMISDGQICPNGDVDFLTDYEF